MNGPKYLLPLEEMCYGGRLNDAVLQRLLEEAWQARIEMHQCWVENSRSRITKTPVTRPRDPTPSETWGKAKRRLGKKLLSRLRGNPLEGLHWQMKRWLAHELGGALCKAFFEEGFRRIEASEELWRHRDWDCLLELGFIDADGHKVLHERWPLGPDHDERRKQESNARWEARFQANQGS